MKKPRLIYGTLLFAFAGVIGCHGPSSAPPTTHPDSTPFVEKDTPATTIERTPTSSGADPSLPDQPPAPGTAQALAQRAQTYALALTPPIVAQAQSHRHKPPASDWPDPQAMKLTPDQDSSANSPGSIPGAEPAATPHGTRANASIAIPTAQHLVKADAPVVATSDTPAADDITAKVAARARDYPSDLSAQVDQQLNKFLRDESVPDMQSLAGLIPEDRELLSALMDSLTNFRNQLRSDNNMLFSKKIRPLVELADRLHSQAELSVPTIALCTGVKTFGVYDPIDPARFVAGREQRVVVYCEVENFLSQPDDKNLYETRLTQDIVLYEESSGLPVWTDKKSTYVDLARRRRHDFFMGKIITLPANLTINRYLLKVTVEDQQARHIAENTVPVEIVAQ